MAGTHRSPLQDSAGAPAGGGEADERIALPAGGIVFEELERDLVLQALEQARGNRTRAAQLLGMNRDQIRYRIQKFGLDQKVPEGD